MTDLYLLTPCELLARVPTAVEDGYDVAMRNDGYTDEERAALLAAIWECSDALATLATRIAGDAQ